MLFLELERRRAVDIEDYLQRISNIGVFDGKFPRQENLGEVPVRGEVGRRKTVAAALNDAVGLDRIEKFCRTLVK